ncbi:MAG TPA: peptidase MA family metallohydrolase [Patescibacteria group bacterium]|nr:peptidase MA family metallohydrolase [Patescibacteria group bacterium]
MAPLTPVRPRRVVGLAFLVTTALLAAAGTVMAAEPVTFGRPTASSTFGKVIEFAQPVVIAGDPQRVEVLLSTPGSIGPTVIPSDDSPGLDELRYRIDLSSGHIVPNTTFTVRWRVVDPGGAVWTGPAVSHLYDDDRFAWKTLDGRVVRVHWTDGDDAFGKRALKIGEDAVAATAELLGVTESRPIDFFIYGNQAEFYAALGPATRENVGGQAHPDIRTLFALITPADIGASWVESVVPHELTHLVFATAIDNPYHGPPHWLNEGLAVYLSDGYGDSDRKQVDQAVKAGSIIPLAGLTGAFPTTRDRFFLAYAESVSAVDRIVRVNGRDALVKLIRSYADGVSDDEAFQAALGRDVGGFESEWLNELGARPPTRRGPVAAPVGPLPDGWAGPQPDPPFEVTGSHPPVTPGSPLPPTGGTGGLFPVFLRDSLGQIGLAVLVVLVAVAVRRARRRTDPTTWAVQGDNRLFGRPPTVDPNDDAWSPPPTDSRGRAEDWAPPRGPAGPAPATDGDAPDGDAPDRDAPDRDAPDGEAPDPRPSDR